MNNQTKSRMKIDFAKATMGFAIVAAAGVAAVSCQEAEGEMATASFDYFEIRSAGTASDSVIMSDSFDGPGVARFWETEGSPSAADTLTSLTARPGALSLRRGVKEPGDKRATVMQTSAPRAAFDCRAEVSFAPADTSSRAGLTLWVGAERQYQICTGKLPSGARTVDVRSVTREAPQGVLESRTPLLFDKLELRLLRLEDGHAVFCYATDSRAWVAVKELQTEGDSQRVGLFVE